MTTAPREPRVFSVDDPMVADPIPTDEASPSPDAESETAAVPQFRPARMTATGILVSAMSGLVILALSVSMGRFVSQALERNDWVGWTATSFLIVAVLAALVIIARELSGLLRLARVTRLRRDIEKALHTGDRVLEKSTVEVLHSLYRNRPEMSWSLARLKDHQADIQDAGDLLRLADREVMSPLDATARRLILRSAKNVSVVTAMSPIVSIAMLYVVVENLRMLRNIASLYGGRPGAIGALRLTRMVVTHIVATGGLALTDDLLGQFLGQDLLRRLSRRLGEGAFNGALTARVGAAAIHVMRPIPFLDAEPIRVRDLLPELLQSVKGRLTQLAIKK